MWHLDYLEHPSYDIMKKLFPILFLGLMSTSLIAQNHKEDSIQIRAIYDEILLNSDCYENLRVLCKDVGNRLSGSEGAEKAVNWGHELLTEYGFDNVRLEEVMVPKWERGCCEAASVYSKLGNEKLNVCALGGSVGTDEGIRAQIVEVKYLKDLEKLGREKVEGKIVFYNRPLDPLFINTGSAYGSAFDQRGSGAAEAAKYGAVGALVRSLTLATDSFPHTGAMNYEEGGKMIPAAAVSTLDAGRLREMLKEDPNLELEMNLNCVRHPDVASANVIAEIKGSEFPDKIIVVGGHLDSWDIGEGAHDDGAGVVQSIEVLRTLRSLGIKPRHTIRVVLYMNEENGNNGGKTYAANVKKKNEYHVAALESDAGGLTPRGFQIDGREDQAERFKSWAPLFEPYNLHIFKRGWTGVDIGPLKNDTIALFGLVPDSQRYFDYHHSENDVFENVHKRELELGAAAATSLIYMIDKYGWD